MSLKDAVLTGLLGRNTKDELFVFWLRISSSMLAAAKCEPLKLAAEGFPDCIKGSEQNKNKK